MEQPKKHPAIKRIVFVLMSIVVIAGIAWGTTTLLARLTQQKKQEEVKILTPKQQAAEDAKKNMEKALGSENKGDTAAAIAGYKEALKNYRAADDKAGEAGVLLKLQYLESLSK